MSYDPGYTCAFHFMCSERGVPSVAGGWFDHPKLMVPDESQDMVYHGEVRRLAQSCPCHLYATFQHPRNCTYAFLNLRVSHPTRIARFASHPS